MKFHVLLLILMSVCLQIFGADDSHSEYVKSTATGADIQQASTLMNLMSARQYDHTSSVYFDDLMQNDLIKAVLSTIILFKSNSQPEFAETVLKELWPESDQENYALLLRGVACGYKKSCNDHERLDKAMQLNELSYNIKAVSRPLINMSEVRYFQGDWKAAAFYLAKANEISRLSDQDNKALEMLYASINEDSSEELFQKTVRDIMRFEKANLYRVDC